MNNKTAEGAEQQTNIVFQFNSTFFPITKEVNKIYLRNIK
jgi:hypothetical protein